MPTNQTPPRTTTTNGALSNVATLRPPTQTPTTTSEPDDEPGKNLVRVRVADLKVDPGYQRPLNAKRAHAMAGDAVWDERIFNPPLINLRGGQIFIVDGQHTVEGAKKRGLEEIAAWQLDPPVSRKEEAALFAKINGNRVAVKAYNNFMARQTAGDAVTLRISHILRALQIELIGGGHRSHTARRTRSIGCTAAMEKAYQNVRERLSDVLSVVGDAFGYTHDAFKGSIIIAVARLIRAFPEIDLVRLSTQIRNEFAGPREMEKAAMEANRMFTNSQRDMIIARLMVNAYNKRLAHANKLDEVELSIRTGGWINTPG